MANKTPSIAYHALYGGKKATPIMASIRQAIRENKRRVPCAHCRNLVLPEKMDQHLRVYHS